MAQSSGVPGVFAVIVIGFKCKDCSLEAQVEMRDRRPGEDVVAWIDEIGRRAGDHHGIVAPLCRGDACDLTIPLDERSLSSALGAPRATLH